MNKKPFLLLTVPLFLAFTGLTSVHAQDADAAKALLKDNKCTKCHHSSRDKTGPSLKKISAKYKGKAAEGEEAMIKAMTTGPTVKLDDGSEEQHAVIETKDAAALKNLAQYILSQ